VPGPAARRLQVVDAVRDSGGEVLRLESEEARLDSLYRELVGAEGDDAGTRERGDAEAER
jgi:hypothetical protein